MKQKHIHLLLALLCAAFAADVRAQGTAFTYQGRLNDGANLASGIYDLRFAIYDAMTVGGQQGNLLTNTASAVSNGLFTVTLDFGNQFPGANRWLEIGVRSNSVGTFQTLTPRQPLTPTPYAITAGNLSGTLPATQLTGTVPNAQLSASVSLLGTNIDSAEITDGTISTNDLNGSVLNGTFWKLGGNTGANPANGIFLGTTDNQPLEFKVNNQRGLRLEYWNNVPFEGVNVIGGSGNLVANGAIAATIAGGGELGFGINQVTGDLGTIGGGVNNTAGFSATVSGGQANAANGPSATVGGGEGNIAGGAYATIPGGVLNTASNDFSFAAGTSAKANHSGTFVWADSVGGFFGPAFASTGTNQFLIRASGGVAIGTNDPAGAALRVAGTVTADGMGIGTGSPGESLDVVVDESAKNFGGIRVRNINPTIGGERTVLFDLLNNDPSSAVTYRLQNVGNVSGRSGNFEIYQLGGAAGGARLAIATNGNVGIGTTAPNTEKLVVVGGVDVTTAAAHPNSDLGMGLSYESYGGRIQTFNSMPLVLNPIGNNVGIGRTPTANKLEVEGNASKTAAGSWLANSDRRIKQDIAPVAGALDTLNRVRLVSFRYTDEYRSQHPSIEDRPYLNVIAQEFAKVFPDAVKSSGEKLPDGSAILQVDTYPLTIYSAAAIQELDAKQRELRAEKDKQIGELKTENAELKARLEKLEQFMNSKTVAAK